MSKYPISKEFFPKSKFAPIIPSPAIAGFLGRMMKTPKWIFKNKEVNVRKEFLEYDQRKIELIIFEPRNIDKKTPAICYFHGGGFFFGAGRYHYELMMMYVKALCCKVIFVQYRLAPKYRFPIPVLDCFEGYKWVLDNSEKLKIDENRIAVGGDSAGGSLAAGVTLMCRDKMIKMPLFQLLIYPVLDRTMNTESNRKFVDTPMWNSKLSKKMWRGYLNNADEKIIHYASPVEVNDVSGVSPAYIEVAEFDCLRDEGIIYYNMLKEKGINTVLNEIKGTMHGFDIVLKATITKEAIKKRIEYMKNIFYK